MIKDENGTYHESPMNEWFELSHAQFLTIPRVVMESMPYKWQVEMKKLLEEVDETFDWRPREGRYWVRLRDNEGRFSSPDLCDYRHGNIEHLRIKDNPKLLPEEKPCVR